MSSNPLHRLPRARSAVRSPAALLALLVLALGACAESQTAAPANVPAVATAPAPMLLAPEMRVVSGPGAVLPVPVTSFGAATIGDTLYVLGGYHGASHDYRAEGQSRSLTAISLADGAAPAREVAALPHGLQSPALVAHDGMLYRVGGAVIDDAAEMRSIRTVARIDPETGVETRLPDLPTPRSSHMAAVMGDTLVIAGGWNLQNDSAAAVFADDILTLDLRAPEAGYASHPAPFRVRGNGVAAAGGRVYIVGGMDPDGAMHTETWIFDGAGVEPGPAFSGMGFGVGAVGVGEDLIVIEMSGAVQRLRPGADAFARVDQVAYRRFFHQVVNTPQGVFVVGGTRGMSPSDRRVLIERVSMEDDAPRLTLLDIPRPTAASNRQGIGLVGEQLFVFGGHLSTEQHDFSPEQFVDAGARLDLSSFRSEDAHPFPVPRQSMVGIALSGNRLAFGGGFGHDGEHPVTFRDVFVYDAEADAFSAAPAFAAGRSQFGAALVGGRMIALGGLEYDPRREGMSAFVHPTETVSSTVDETASEMAPALSIPEPRRAFGGVQLGDRYVMVGGMHAGFELVSSCTSLDLNTGVSEPFPCPEQTRLSPELVALEGRLYLLGGVTVNGRDTTPASSVEVYDEEASGWRVVAELPFNTQHLRAFTLGGRIVVFSTHAAEPGRALLAILAP